MADRVKAPKNYKRGRDLSHTPTAPARTEMCKAAFPCLVNIYVLAGLEQPCAPCAPEIQRMRDLHGYRAEGRFWICDGLTEDQQRTIRHRIGQADPRNWENAEPDAQDTRTSAEIESDEEDEFDEDSMPTPCGVCGVIFDLTDGKPCRKCRTVYCPDCARWTEEHGWRCVRCEPE